MVIRKNLFGWIISLSILVSIILIFLSYNKRGTVSCATEINIFFSQKYSLHANFQSFIYSDGTGVTTYKGFMIHNGNKYVINRDIPFYISENNNNGDVTLKYQGVVKKNTDTLPDNIRWSNLEKGEVNHFSFHITKTGNYILEVNSMPMYICSY